MAVGLKSLATAVEIWPLVQHCLLKLRFSEKAAKFENVLTLPCKGFIIFKILAEGLQKQAEFTKFQIVISMLAVSLRLCLFAAGSAVEQYAVAIRELVGATIGPNRVLAISLVARIRNVKPTQSSNLHCIIALLTWFAVRVRVLMRLSSCVCIILRPLCNRLVATSVAQLKGLVSLSDDSALFP